MVSQRLHMGQSRPQRCHAAYYTALLTLCMCARMCATDARPLHTNPSGLEMGHRFRRYPGGSADTEVEWIHFGKAAYWNADVTSDDISRCKPDHFTLEVDVNVHCSPAAAERSISGLSQPSGKISERLSGDVKIHRPMSHGGTDHSSRCAN